MHPEIDLEDKVYAAMSPALAAWVLRIVAKDLERRGRPGWARLDLEELASFLTFLGDAVPPRYRSRVPALEESATA